MQFDAGSKCGTCVNLRDVDGHTELATGVRTADLITLKLAPHEARVLRASCC